jgi:predicted amidohydrolase YtcJ
LAVLLAFLSLPTPEALAAVAAPDLILFNGQIFTSDTSHLHAAAIAIRGERIAAVGDDGSIKRLADSRTRLIDLGGRTVIPGLNDAHVHFDPTPPNAVNIDTKGLNPSWQELSAAIRKAAAQAPAGAILSGVFGSTIFHAPAIDGRELDRIEAHHPVILVSFDGHAAILNTAARATLRIEKSIADPMGGRFERSGDGQLNGVAREYAVLDVWRRLDRMVSDADEEASLRKTLGEAARFGITSIQDLPLGFTAERTARLLSLIKTPIRVRITRMNLPTPAGLDFKEGASLPAHPAPLVTVSGTKWLLDGVVFEGSLAPRAAVKPSLAGSPYTFAGLPPLFPPNVVEQMLRDALRHNYQLQVHVFGSRAAVEMLDALDRTGGARVWAKRRLRFEHGDGLTPDLIARAKALGVIVSQQGSHLAIITFDDGLGSDFFARLRVDRDQPIRSLLAAGIPLALGSDGPLNPWIGILGASTHPDRPDEAIGREQAVIAYTLGSAYAEFTDKDKGTLSPGKLADLAVLSQDIFSVPLADLTKTHSALTIVGGKVVYEDQVWGTPR